MPRSAAVSPSTTPPIAPTITNSTLSGNVGFFGGALFGSAPLAVNNSTINANLAVVGGGLYAAAPLVAGAVQRSPAEP